MFVGRRDCGRRRAGSHPPVASVVGRRVERSPRCSSRLGTEHLGQPGLPPRCPTCRDVLRPMTGNRGSNRRQQKSRAFHRGEMRWRVTASPAAEQAGVLGYQEKSTDHGSEGHRRRRPISSQPVVVGFAIAATAYRSCGLAQKMGASPRSRHAGVPGLQVGRVSWSPSAVTSAMVHLRYLRQGQRRYSTCEVGVRFTQRAGRVPGRRPGLGLTT